MNFLTNALVFAVSFVIFIQPARSYEVVTFETLKNLVETKKVESIEALLPHLPPTYLQNFAMVKHSQSLQGATPLNPRILLFGESAESVLAFNGGANQRGHDSIEMVEFKTATGKFEFHEIRFANGTVTFSEANPRKCVGCHQGRNQDLRPNWDEYPHWPNAYGAEDDFLSAEERTQMDQFLQARPSHPRYRHLSMAEGGPYYGEKFGAFIGRPNLRLTTLLNRWNARKVAAQLKTNPQYSVWRDLVLLELTDDSAAYQRGLAKARELEVLTDKDLEDINAGLSVLDKMGDSSGLNARDWSLKFMARAEEPQRSSRTSRISKLPYAYFDGFSQIQAYVLGELWRSTEPNILNKISFSLFANDEKSKYFSQGIESYIQALDEIAPPPELDQDLRAVAPLLETSLLNRGL